MENIETMYNKNPICPYCGEELEDVWDYDFEDDKEDEIDCPNCEKKYTVVGHVDWTYNTFK